MGRGNEVGAGPEGVYHLCSILTMLQKHVTTITVIQVEVLVDKGAMYVRVTLHCGHLIIL